MTSTKVCFKCGQEKPISLFYPHREMRDGRLNKCIDCTKADVAAYQKTPPGREVKSRAERRYRRENPAYKEAGKRWERANPEKKRAQTALGNAVRDGKVQRQPCEVCGSTKVHGHHDDYGQPLNVRWLCPLHHKAAHKSGF